MTRAPAFVLILIAACAIAHADGGRLRFSKPAGPFLVTLFTIPEPLTPGPVDFSVMVQDNASGRIIPAAAIRLHLTAPDGEVVDATASQGQTPNQLLQAAEVNLPRPATWRLSIDVREANRAAVLEDEPIVVEEGSRRATLVWVFLLLPLAAVGLFALHQNQKTKSRRKAQPAD